MELVETMGVARPRPTASAAQAVVGSRSFRSLVARRWTVNVALLALLFAGYYGYILLVAWNRSFMATRIGRVTTLAIPIGVGVILFAWLLTALYVAWANRSYDPEVERLKGQLGER